ncbi:MAG: hypothetical protein ABGX72_01420, partial [Methyloprofundus sp.]
LHLLSNINVNRNIMLQLVLVGQSELVDTLNQPELVRFSQPISIEYHLKPLNYKETKQYIHYRLKVVGSENFIIHPSSCTALHYYFDGTSRLIYNLGDLALIFAFAADKKKIN